ncbi:MAG: L-seryl-tRNA(Sec) selenium transferase, partial [Candidatus Cloacimonetes bacterium]|nr:L-seryl-tRNA(Sec) selenium transferase [Candidatus Cloacimonadota bacterium]
NATLLEYLKGKAEEEVPVLAMLSQKPEKLNERARHWQARLGTGEVVESKSTIGGGSLPEQELQTWCLAITPSSAKRFTSRLRQYNPPVIARIENEQVLLDPRTVFPKDEEILLSHLSNALTEDKK